MYLKKNIKKNIGFTLVEMMVFLFIFSVVSLTFYELFVSGTKAMGNVRRRLDALAIANEKIEIIHNLNYEDAGTIGGIPAGQIIEDEIINRDSKNFFVHTSIIGIDDPFDGTAENETDTNPEDYKQVRVDAYWEEGNPVGGVSLVSTIIPPGLESVFTGGILSLHVVDNSGQGIPNANVSIRNDSLNPIVNTTLTTNDQGNLFLLRAEPANQSYNISISKSGYFPIQTYAPYPENSVNPVDINATVVGGAINQKTLVTDRVSSISLSAKTALGIPVPNLTFGLFGGKQIGNTIVSPPDSPEPVWFYNQNSLDLGADGVIEFSDMSSGPYFLTYGNSVENLQYEFLYMEPMSSTKSSFDIYPNTETDEFIIVADKSIPSFWGTIIDDIDETPIAEAVVNIKNQDESYNVTLTANKFGQVYFPDTIAVLVNGDYKMSVSATGYDLIENQDININNFTAQEIRMTTE